MKPQRPTLWLVIGDKVGDNRQLELIASRLDWPTVRKELRFRPPFDRREGKPPIRPTLAFLDPDRSAPLSPPWPDLILTIGRRPLSPALWIKTQSPETLLVVVGRPPPARWLSLVDLVAVPPYYLAPQDRRILRLPLPLHRPPLGAVLEEPLGELPRPITAVLIGGETRPFRFGPKEASDLLSRLRAAFPSGTLYLTTSRRTPPEVIALLQEELPGNARLYRYGIDPPSKNPYLPLLAGADRFVVTGDSVSMITEALHTRKPLWIYEPPLDLSFKEQLRTPLFSRPRLWEIGYRLGLFSSFRDLGRFHRELYRRGLAAPLGAPEPCRTAAKLPDPIDGVVAAISALFERPLRSRPG